MTELGDADVLITDAGALCEGPCWDARSANIVWVDILAGRVHAARPTTGTHVVRKVHSVVSAVIPRRSGGWLAAVERGFALFDDHWTQQGPVMSAADQPEGTRFNDGRCDPQGRLWAGTIAYDGTPHVAALYRLDPNGKITQVLDGVTNSNGLGWSLDGNTMYYVDTGRRAIDRMDFDQASGTVRNRRTLVAVPPSGGLPDGLTVDSEGYLWVALWGGACVRRYAPDGTLDRVVGLPVAQVTSMAFGGAELDELFITTASEGLSASEREAQPLAGSVFRHRPGVTGLLPNAFAG
jgi:sugar lactone lactonase YvrE